MSDSKQTAASTVRAKSKPVAVKKSSKANGNGKAPENQLADEVKKLDQIRDMLFGEHVETLQNKYQSLDKTLDENVADLRKELTASIAELKQQIDNNFKQLQKSLKSEQDDRLSQNEELNTTLTNLNTDLDTKIDLEAKRLDEALDEQHKEASSQLNSVANSLQDAKVDRKSLASLFSQIAKELEG